MLTLSNWNAILPTETETKIAQVKNQRRIQIFPEKKILPASLLNMPRFQLSQGKAKKSGRLGF